MSEKRKDLKGRILRTGESQRKDGKYEYKYVDVKGVRRSAYSWKLVDTDKIPTGKRCTESLRAIEKRLEEDINAGVDTYAGENITFEECAKMYIQSKNFKETTKITYERIVTIVCNFLHNITIGEITENTVLSVCNSMLNKNFAPSSVDAYFRFIKSVLNYAYDNGYIKKPLKEGLSKTIFPSGWQSIKKKSLTKEEESEFLEYVHNSKTHKHWEPVIIFALGTGCRINEIFGLQWGDCDFQKQTIHICRGIHYIDKKGESRFVISTTKTVKSNRIIPMIPTVKQTLLQLKKAGAKIDLPVDGLSDFVFVSQNNTPMNRKSFDYALKSMVSDYNKKAIQENKPLLPNVSAHIFRHTFCTRYCEVESNVKIIQEIMGHSNISTTLDIYTDVTEKQKQKSLLAHSEHFL